MLPQLMDVALFEWIDASEPLARDSPEEIARDVKAIGRIEALPTILEVLCELTGMRFAAVARVTERTWTACAIKDELSFGVSVGGQLPVDTTLCLSKHLNEPIAISNASANPTLSNERATSEVCEQFIAILGHDLRNPLQAVAACSEMLARKADDPALVQRLAGRIKTNVKRMSLLIEDVLDFARAKLGDGLSVIVGGSKMSSSERS